MGPAALAGMRVLIPVVGYRIGASEAGIGAD